MNVGYGRERLADAAAEQLKRLAFHPLTRGHVPAIELGERLDELLGGERATFYANSGSEANELAFKLVRQYHQLRGEPQPLQDHRPLPRLPRLDARRAVGDRPGDAAQRLRAAARPASSTSRRPTPTATGSPTDDLDAYGRRCAADLERTIEFELPETVAAVIMEPIITGGGILIPPDSYLPAVKAACERHGVLLIVDEVICGFGRTGTWFGHDAVRRAPRPRHDGQGHHERLLPARRHRRERRRSSPRSRPTRRTPGRLRHINTFGGHPAGCAVALETIAIMEEEGLLERSATVGRRRCSRGCATRSATTRSSARCAGAGC